MVSGNFASPKKLEGQNKVKCTFSVGDITRRFTLSIEQEKQNWGH